jgi:galactitol-specific phosphotransferase system IIB component
MKRFKFISALTLMLFLSRAIYSQSITGTLGSGGVFKVKDATNDYLTLSQSNGNLSVLRNLELGGIPTSTATVGVITKNGLRFIHNYQAPGTDGLNTFIGLEAGNFTMSGSLQQASYNTGVGYSSLYSLTTGYENSAFGNLSLYSNTTGRWNSALGNEALYSNTTGGGNSAFGRFSLYSNTTGSYNSAFGWGSLAFNITGNYNTSIGDYAGINIETGSNNIAIGYNTQVPSGSGDNQIRLGNTAITYAGIQVAWTVTSDRRYKENINPIGLGLGFISKLNPVSYQRKNDENKKTEYGLIAQEVEQVLKELGIENHAMLTITDEGMYELRYNDLIAPMIKAIQELKEKSDEKDIEIAKLKGENKEIKSQLNEIIQVVNELKEKQDAVKNVKFGEK